MREQPGISAERLKQCLRENYKITSTTLNFLPLGLDYRAGIYRFKDEQGVEYLLKVTTRPLYAPGCFVPAYLYQQGITSVVAPLPTTKQTLWVKVEDWTVIVYPYHEGESSWRGMTDEQWMTTGIIFKQIHQTALPSIGLELLRKETFDSSVYTRWISMFEEQYLNASSGESIARRTLRSAWIEKQVTIHTIVATLERLAKILQRRELPLVICHADLHPCNLLRASTGDVFVIDWDEVMLAPRERDFVLIKVSSADSETLPGTSAFFQGYGQVDIDWTVLTYYRYERVIQDVVACAENVCLRDELGEVSRESEAQLFQEVLSEGGEIDAARAAALLSLELF